MILLERLGKGGFGEVRKGIHKASGIKRAIKMVHKTDLKDEEKDRLIDEVETLKNLVFFIVFVFRINLEKDHPNIIKVFESYEDDKYVYIVTELCTGGELFDRVLNFSCSDERETANIMKQIFSAVLYLHNRNIVHRFSNNLALIKIIKGI